MTKSKIRDSKANLWLLGLIAAATIATILISLAHPSKAATQSVGTLTIDISNGTYRASASGQVRHWQYVIRDDATCNQSIFSPQGQSSNLTAIVWSNAYTPAQTELDKLWGQYICFKAVDLNGKGHQIGRQLSFSSHFSLERRSGWYKIFRKVNTWENGAYYVIDNSGLDFQWFRNNFLYIQPNELLEPSCNLVHPDVDDPNVKLTSANILRIKNNAGFHRKKQLLHEKFLCFLGISPTTGRLVEMITKMEWPKDNDKLDIQPLTIVKTMKEGVPTVYAAIDPGNYVKNWSYVVSANQQCAKAFNEAPSTNLTSIAKSHRYQADDNFDYRYICFRAELHTGDQVYLYTQMKPLSDYLPEPELVEALDW